MTATATPEAPATIPTGFNSPSFMKYITTEHSDELSEIVSTFAESVWRVEKLHRRIGIEVHKIQEAYSRLDEASFKWSEMVDRWNSDGVTEPT